MTKKEYCTTHASEARHNYYNSYIHGVEYGLDGDYLYISQRVQVRLFGPCVWEFHKLKTKADSEGFIYISFPEKHYDGTVHYQRRYLEEYTRLGIWEPGISLEEWQQRLEGEI